MPAIINPSRWLRRPVLGAQINWSHPIANGLVAAYLFNDGAGDTVSNLVNPADKLTISGTSGAVWAAGSDGVGLYAPNSGIIPGAALAAPSAALKPTNAVSMLWRGIIAGDGFIANNPPLFGMNHNTSSAAPYESYTLNRKNGAQGDLYGLHSAGGSLNIITVSGGISAVPYGTPVGYGFARTDGRTTIYRDGQPIGSDSVSGALTYDATAFLSVNRDVPVDGGSCNTISEVGLIWNRELSQAEYLELSVNPYCLVVPPRVSRRYFLSVPGNSGTASVVIDAPAIAASGSMTISGTGAVTISRPGIDGVAVIPDTGAIAISAPGISGTGGVSISGTASITIAVPALYGAGTSTIINTGNVTIGPSATYGTGTVSIPGPAELLCFVAGKHARLLTNTTSISRRMNTRSTGSCTLFSPQGVSPVRPLAAQEIKFVDSLAGRIEFTGKISKVITTLIPGRTTLPAYKFVCSFEDLSSVLDRRVVDKTYAAGTAAATIARDIVATFLTGENVTTNNVTSTASITQELVLRGAAMECMKKLCDATGDLFYIDDYNDMNMFAPGAGGAAPFTLTDTGNNTRDLQLIDTDVGLANNVFMRSNQNLGVNEALA